MKKACDYSSSEFGKKCNRLLATKLVRITYGPMDEDVFYLCDACALLAEQDAKKKKGQVKIRDFNNN